MALEAIVEGIGLIGPGLRSWSEGRAILTGAMPYVSSPTELSAPSSLPASERRRASRATKVVLATGLEAASGAGCDPASLATVFASSAGDGVNCHEICQQLASGDRQLSPTRFHNSVHNAPAGYWGIASGSMASSSVICAHDASFGAGLLEAIAHVVTLDERCLLLAYDADYPEPLRSIRQTPDAMGIALLLAPRGAARGRSAIPGGPGTIAGGLATIVVDNADAPMTTLADGALESLRTAIAAARGLPLLSSIARAEAGAVFIEYLHGRTLAIDVQPC